MAAAPDMLSALRALVQAWEEGRAPSDRQWRNALDAITKAEG
jgi:hypothetical protein